MSNGPRCQQGEECRDSVMCTPDTCEYGQKGWKHAAYHIKHFCAHDFDSGEVVSLDDGTIHTKTCICGMTAFAHDMRYGP